MCSGTSGARASARLFNGTGVRSIESELAPARKNVPLRVPASSCVPADQAHGIRSLSPARSETQRSGSLACTASRNAREKVGALMPSLARQSAWIFVRLLRS